MPPKKHPLKVRELIKRLHLYGVIKKPGGKGSELILIRPTTEAPPWKGPQFTIKHHSDSDDVHEKVIAAILRRFGIDEEEFWTPSSH